MKKQSLFLLFMAIVLIFSFAACNGNYDDIAGKSAYQIWLDEGHSGTESDFLNWIKGSAGSDGQDGTIGKSAYQVWLDEGHSGTEADFLDWIKGESGLGAYQIYKQNNPDYQGSEQQWIDDLQNGRLAKYTVIFNSNGGTEVSPVLNMLKGDKISEPTTPYRMGSVFAGWFNERELISIWDFDKDTIFSDITLYAKWVESQEPLLFTPISDTTNCSVMANYDYIEDLETLVIPEATTINGIEYTVTEVEGRAFIHLYNLKVVILPETLSKINNEAFAVCKSLRTIYMPNVENIGRNAFALCSKIEHVFLPLSLSTIDVNAFYGYERGRSYPLNIHIAGNEASVQGWIHNIGVSADGDLSNIIYNSTYTGLDNLSFADFGTTECNVKINGEARTTLETLYLPPVFSGRLVTQIQTTGFSDCLNLREVILPATVKTIYESAFYNCPKLESIHLSDVENIGAYVFSLNPKLKELTIPVSVGQISECILTINGQTRENHLTVYVDAEYDTIKTLNWSTKWQQNSGSNFTVIYGWLMPAKITLDSNGGNTISTLIIQKGKISKLPSTYKDNYTFAGWFKDEELIAAWDFDNDIIVEDLTLYAAWTEGEAATTGLSYTLINDNSEYRVSRGIANLTGRLVIPAEYNGKPITSIDHHAFANMNILGLTSQISSVSIPDTITDLGTQSFYGCTLLTSVKIPAGVIEIGSAFDKCSGIRTITVSPNSETFYSENNCVIRKSNNVLVFGCSTSIIPDYVKGIGDNAFMGCAQLKSVNIPYGVEFIGESSFAQCDNLKTVIIPDSVQSIGEYSFWNCIRLTNINIPHGIEEISDYAFDSCYWLASIAIPDSVVHLGSFALSSTALSSIFIPDSVKTLGDFTFSDCKNLTSVVIPDSVTVIGSNSFVGCVSLVNLTLSNSLTEITTNSFNGCSSLKNLVLPQGLQTIAWSTFVDCTSLKSIVIPNSVTYIGNSAFSRCSSLETIYYGGATQAQWDAIETSYLGPEFLSASVYFYSESQPTETGNFWHYDTDGVTPVKW